MAVQNISSVVNASFIRSFQGLASSGGPAIGAGASSKPSISSGLRLGARTFAAAIQNLNQTIAVVNLADDKLKKLSKITDKMISLAENGTSLSAGTASRRKLQFEFEKLVTSFRREVADSSINSVEYLTQEGLSALFQKVGLDQATSDGVAKVFKNFTKTLEDSALVSEYSKGKRPPEIPALRKSKVAQISDDSVSSNGGVSPENSIYEGTPIYYQQPVSVDLQGNQSIATTGDGLVLLAVNETKGSTIGETVGNYLVFGAESYTGEILDNNQQVYLFGADGEVLRRVSDINTFDYPEISLGNPPYNFSADISADNLTAAYSFSTIEGNYVHIVQSGSLTSPPGMPIAYSGVANGIKLSNDGQYIAYNDGAEAFIAPTSGDIFAVRQSLGNSLQYGFADSSTVVFKSESDTISAVTYGDLTVRNLITDPNLDKLNVLEGDARYSDNDGVSGLRVATIAYTSSTALTNNLTVASFDLDSDSLKTRYRRELGAGTVDNISLTYQDDLNKSKDRVDVGVVGTLPAIYGDTNREFYRVTENRYATNNSLFAQAMAEPNKSLDGSLLTRADSYRLLSDLKALKKQMKDNSSALDDAREYIATNISFARTAGFAFLDISNQLSGVESAASVAELVANEIRKNASTAQMAQIENLRNIATETVGLLS